MDKSQLIATILSEVKDPALRERLLRQVAEEEKTSDHSPSIVLSELQKLGIDPDAAKSLAGFHLTAGVVVGYLVGGLFFVGGTIITLAQLFGGNLFTALFAGFFAAMGVYALASTRKLSRLKSQRKENR
jgi:hypothetical protein